MPGLDSACMHLEASIQCMLSMTKCGWPIRWPSTHPTAPPPFVPPVPPSATYNNIGTNLIPTYHFEFCVLSPVGGSEWPFIIIIIVI